jgi:RecA-family ATPase
MNQQAHFSQLPPVTHGYLKHGAHKGNRNNALMAASCQFRDAGCSIGEAKEHLIPRAEEDGLSSKEAESTINSAFRKDAREPIIGNRPQPKQSLKFRKIETKAEELPGYITDGWQKLIEIAFEPDEFVSIGCGFIGEPRDEQTGEVKKYHAIDGGSTWTVKELIGKLKTKDSRLFHFGNHGAYIRINPILDGGKGDEHVTDFRHALVECDNGTKEEQLGALQKIGLPITAIIDSGGKSIHAWVRIDARDRKEYDERVSLIYRFCKESLGMDLDEGNKNPSRYSRLPDGVRTRIDKKTCEEIVDADGRPIIDVQRLLAHSLPGKPWSEWSAEVATNIERTYKRFDLDEMLDFRPADDPDCLVGNRWLGKGGSFVLTGEPGHGKTSLALYFLSKWAIGEAAFGLDPDRPLKCVFVQAENDFGDMAEPLKGQIDRKSLSENENKLLKDNLIILQDCESTGPAKFAEMLQGIIDEFKPDVVVADPLMSYAGCDLSRQDQMSGFLYNTLNPLIKKAGVLLGFVHHDKKPGKDKDGKPSNSRAMHNSFGSVVISAWAREMISLVCTDEQKKQFELHFGKRSSRTGVGGVVRIRHTQEEGVIRWEQMNFEGTATGPSKAEKHAKMEADVLRLLKSKDKNGATRRSDVEHFAAQNGYNKKDCWNAAQALAGSGDHGLYVIPFLNTFVISADPNYRVIDPEADQKKVLAFIKSNVLVTQNMLTKKWNDPAAPPRDKRTGLANNLVDDEEVFSDSVQVHIGKPASKCWSYAKHPALCVEEIARLNGMEISKIAPDEEDPFK